MLWLGPFGGRVCWWDVGLLVISALAGGKSFCWRNIVLLVKRALLAKRDLLAKRILLGVARVIYDR